jgi:Xaa-Pro dipeptidase
MEVLDATSLVNRLRGEAKEYWLHLEAETPLDKYPGKLLYTSRGVQSQS